MHTSHQSSRGTDESQVTGQEDIAQHPKVCFQAIPTHSHFLDGLDAQESK